MDSMCGTRIRALAPWMGTGGVALVLCLVCLACLVGCAAPELRLGAKPIPATPRPGWDPSPLRLYVEEQSTRLCSTPLPQPRFYARSAEMRPTDTVAVAELGRCLASPDFDAYRVQLVGAPDRTAAAGRGADDRLALERAARVEASLVSSGVAPQRIAITTAHDPDLYGRVDVGLFR